MLSHTTRARAPAAAALGFVVIALSVSACGRGESSSAADGARDAVMTVTAVALERVELTRTISMNGSLYAWQDVIISSEVGGYRVAEVVSGPGVSSSGSRTSGGMAALRMATDHGGHDPLFESN